MAINNKALRHSEQAASQGVAVFVMLVMFSAFAMLYLDDVATLMDSSADSLALKYSSNDTNRTTRSATWNLEQNLTNSFSLPILDGEGIYQDQSTVDKGTIRNKTSLTGASQNQSVLITNQKQNRSYTWDKRGCQQWPIQNETKSQSSVPPTGLVVSLVLAYRSMERRTGANWHRRHVCDFVPSQRAHFIEPHAMDQLILFGGGIITIEQVSDCLNLKLVENSTVHWENLDGTNLTTNEYRSPSGKGRIFMANYEMTYPRYVKHDDPEFMSQIYGKPRPKCRAPPSYILGTNFYASGMFELRILQNYDYWIKLDLDIVFNKTISFHLLHDMRLRGALFAHTAEYLPHGDTVCAQGITKASVNFTETMVHQKQPDWLIQSNWSRPCSADRPELQRDADQYYTNFVIGSVEYWTSDAVLELSRFLKEYSEGWFHSRWTDQVFFHFGLGMFLGPDFNDYVVDYTDFRCSPRHNCWPSTTPDACDNGGYFLHTKSFGWSDTWNRNVSTESALVRSDLFRSTYVHNCTI